MHPDRAVYHNHTPEDGISERRELQYIIMISRKYNVAVAVSLSLLNFACKEFIAPFIAPLDLITYGFLVYLIISKSCLTLSWINYKALSNFWTITETTRKHPLIYHYHGSSHCLFC